MSRKIIIGVAKSDAHAVANQLITMTLREHGYRVINLGVCTPVEAFVEAFRLHPDTEAILIGSLNGHAYDDLYPLKRAKREGAITCPVIIGGNLSIGKEKDARLHDRLRGIGVDYILDGSEEILSLLAALESGNLSRIAS